MCDLLRGLEHNVRFVFLFTLAYTAATSILSEQVLSGYIYVLTGSNAPVGIVKGIQGLAQLLCAFPAGWAADRLRRDRLLQVAGVLGIGAALVTALAIQLGALRVIYGAFALWGIFAAIQSPAMEALFADSVPAGRRSMPFTLKHLVLNAALVLGPASAILLFLYYGDLWSLPVLRAVLLFGALVAAVSMGLLFQFDDDQAYENRARQLEIERQLRSIERNFDAELSDYNALDPDRRSSLLTRSTDIGDRRSSGFVTVSGRGQGEAAHLLLSVKSPGQHRYLTHPTEFSELGDESDDDLRDRPRVTSLPMCCGLNPEHVPYVLFVSDFIISNGTGLTANFFPLFFSSEYGLSPVDVQWLFVAQPLCVGLAALLAQCLSRCIGRMPVIVLARTLGTICLLLMSQLTAIESQRGLFLVRAAMLGCTEPLRRSLLMDFVPRSQRARWNSLEGLAMFSWTGSAVVGGFLVEAHGYRVCFLVASLVYTLGVLMEITLIPLTRHAVEYSGPPM